MSEPAETDLESLVFGERASQKQLDVLSNMAGKILEFVPAELYRQWGWVTPDNTSAVVFSTVRPETAPLHEAHASVQIEDPGRERSRVAAVFAHDNSMVGLDFFARESLHAVDDLANDIKERCVLDKRVVQVIEYMQSLTLNKLLGRQDPLSEIVFDESTDTVRKIPEIIREVIEEKGPAEQSVKSWTTVLSAEHILSLREHGYSGITGEDLAKLPRLLVTHSDLSDGQIERFISTYAGEASLRVSWQSQEEEPVLNSYVNDDVPRSSNVTSLTFALADAIKQNHSQPSPINPT